MAKDNRSAVKLGDADLSPEEAIQRSIQYTVSEFSGDEHPDISNLKHFVIQKSKRTIKLAKCWDIRSRRTREYKFSSLVLETLKVTKKRGWESEKLHSITLGDKDNPDAIERLIRFLSSVKSVDTRGDVIVFGANGIDISRLREALNFVSGQGQQNEVLSEIIEWIHEDSQAVERLKLLSKDVLLRSQSLIAAINYLRYHMALTEFQEMVDNILPERDYQKFLEENHWLFGSEYSELIDKRTLVVGQQLDFPLRRTVDGQLEVIEIKTPLNGKSGFKRDSSHGNFYPGADIYKPTSQVLKYLFELEKDHYKILAKHGIEVTRVRGKLVIGRDGTEEEQEARRLYNANSRLIEVLSFDSLISIGERILQIMIDENPILEEMHSQNTEEDDIP